MSHREPTAGRASRLFDLPLPWLLALRYLRSARRDAFASFLSAVAAGGIALGVAALILVLALLSGFQRALRAEVLSRTPQLRVEVAPGSDAREVLAAAAAAPGIREASLVLPGRGWLLRGGLAEPVEIVGFDGPVPASFPGAAGQPEGLYVSSDLALRWGLGVGDVVEIASPEPTLSPLGPQPRVRSLPLAGTFSSSAVEERERAALPLRVATTLFPSERPRIELDAGGLAEAVRAAPGLAAALPAGAEVSTWRDLNRALLFALRLEKGMTFVAVGLVVVVASLALIADLALIISSKHREIGMLAAMGAARAAIRRAFLLLGALVAGSGAAVGAILGVSLAWVLDRYALIPVPGQVYFVDSIPFRVQAGDVLTVLAVTALLAFASSLYAARRATAMSPVEALRR